MKSKKRNIVLYTYIVTDKNMNISFKNSHISLQHNNE